MQKEIVLENNETVMATRKVNSHVIGASFPGVVISNLEDNVKVTFQHLQVNISLIEMHSHVLFGVIIFIPPAYEVCQGGIMFLSFLCVCVCVCVCVC